MRIHEIVDAACAELDVERSGVSIPDMKAICARVGIEFTSVRESAKKIAREVLGETLTPLAVSKSKVKVGAKRGREVSVGKEKKPEPEAARAAVKGKREESGGKENKPEPEAEAARRERFEVSFRSGADVRGGGKNPDVTFTSVKPSQKLSRLFKKFAERTPWHLSDLCFLIDGERVTGHLAVAALAEEQSVEIDVFLGVSDRIDRIVSARAMQAAVEEEKRAERAAATARVLKEDRPMQVFVRTLRGSTIIVHVKPSDDVLELKRKICQNPGCDMQYSDLTDFSVNKSITKLEDGRTLLSYNVHENATLQLRMRLSGDIGIFGSHRGTPGLALLSSRGPPAAAVAAASGTALEELVRSLPRPPFLAVAAGRDERAEVDRGYGYSAHEDAVLLDAGERRLLLSELESKYEASQAVGQPVDASERDFKLYLDRSQLKALLGGRGVHRLEAFFADKFGLSGSRLPSLKYALRRCVKHGECINFHRDYAKRTMQVVLNDDFVGGDLLFISRGKAGGLSLARPRRPAGSATCHDWTIPHG